MGPVIVVLCVIIGVLALLLWDEVLACKRCVAENQSLVSSNYNQAEALRGLEKRLKDQSDSNAQHQHAVQCRKEAELKLAGAKRELDNAAKIKAELGVALMNAGCEMEVFRDDVRPQFRILMTLPAGMIHHVANAGQENALAEVACWELKRTLLHTKFPHHPDFRYSKRGVERLGYAAPFGTQYRG